MGLLDNLMPGENYGIPTSQGKMAGLLDDPLFQIGLGILANNTTRNAGANIGRGALQGIQNIRQGKQLDYEKQLRDIQLQTAQRAKTKDDRLEQARAAFKLAHPDLADAVDLDPSLAIKAAYPNIGRNSADPYFTTVATDKGLFAFDARSGKLTPLNQGDAPLVKSTDSPLVRGAVKAAESQAAASYKPNTDIPGVVSTDAQVAQGAYGGQPMPYSQPQQPQIIDGKRTIPAQPMPTNNFNTPYPVTFGAPGTTATDRLERTMTDESVGVRNPARPNVQGSYAPPVSGISVPTPAEKAGAVKTAEINATTATDNQKAVKKSDQLLSAAKTAETLLKSNPTHSGVGSVLDSAGRLVGISTEANNNATKLETLSGWMVANVPRMEGPQSNFDVQNYQTMAGKVGDRTLPIQERLGALSTLKDLQEKYKAINQVPIGGDTSITNNSDKNIITPPKGAINTLRMNPKLRDQFDAKYGAGAAAQVLGK